MNLRMRFCLHLVLPALLLMAGWTSARAEENAPDKPARIRLHVRASDPNGTKLSFSWTQLEGPIVKIDDPLAGGFDDTSKKWISETYFTPPNPGTYTFEVTVRNEAGLESKKRFVLEAKKGGTEQQIR